MALFTLGASFIAFSLLWKVSSTTPSDAPENRPSRDGIPNPAAEYCIEHKGVYFTQIDHNGAQRGLCKFEDESECLDFPFFRGECRPGECLAWRITSITPFLKTGPKDEPVCVAKFESLEARARHRGEDACTPPSVGTCKGVGEFLNPVLWVYEGTIQACREFQWNGCVPSKYLFLTQETCESVCGHAEESVLSDDDVDRDRDQRRKERRWIEVEKRTRRRTGGSGLRKSENGVNWILLE